MRISFFLIFNFFIIFLLNINFISSTVNVTSIILPPTPPHSQGILSLKGLFPLPLEQSFPGIEIQPYFYNYDGNSLSEANPPVEGKDLLIYFSFISINNTLNFPDDILAYVYITSPEGQTKEVHSVEFNGTYSKNKFYLGTNPALISSPTAGNWKIKYILLTKEESIKFENLSSEERERYFLLKSFSIEVMSNLDYQYFYRISILAIVLAIFGIILSLVALKRHRKREILLLIKEIRRNEQIANQIIKDKNKRRTKNLDFDNFEDLSLKRIISEGIIKKRELFGKISSYRSLSIKINLLINKFNMDGSIKHLEDYTRLINYLNFYLKDLDSLCKELQLTKMNFVIRISRKISIFTIGRINGLILNHDTKKFNKKLLELERK